MLPGSVSAVLPAYNEEAVIATTLRRTVAALAATTIARTEVIVVDDGSSDRTREECERVASQLGGVRVVHHASNRGYGAALRSGFATAEGAAIFLMDSDGQFEPSQITLLLRAWDGATVVCGYRLNRRDRFARVASNAAFFALVNARFGRTARDVNCGFKLFPRSVTCGLRCDGALISTELLLRARDQGMRIVDVPVRHLPRLTGAATGARPDVVARAFGELWRMHRGRRHPDGPTTSMPC